MAEYVVQTHGLTKIYTQVEAVGRVCLNVKQGEIYGLIGANGAGKSTLMGMIAGAIRATSGEMRLFGEDTTEGLCDGRKRMGTLIEKPVYYPKLTVVQNLEILRLERGIPGKKCINYVLEQVGLSEVRDELVQGLSIGMKQQLGIAMALLGEPELLLLDEPTKGMDAKGVVMLRELLAKLSRERGVTILISADKLGELYQLATCYGMMHEGRLIQEMTRAQLDERCKKALQLTVDSIGKATWVLENKLETLNFQVLSEETIRSYDYVEEPGTLVKAMMDEGVKIRGITTLGDALETYCLGPTGGGRHD